MVSYFLEVGKNTELDISKLWIMQSLCTLVLGASVGIQDKPIPHEKQKRIFSPTIGSCRSKFNGIMNKK
jgi:hypothetical protein